MSPVSSRANFSGWPDSPPDMNEVAGSPLRVRMLGEIERQHDRYCAFHVSRRTRPVVTHRLHYGEVVVTAGRLRMPGAACGVGHGQSLGFVSFFLLSLARLPRFVGPVAVERAEIGERSAVFRRFSPQTALLVSAARNKSGSASANSFRLQCTSRRSENVAVMLLIVRREERCLDCKRFQIGGCRLVQAIEVGVASR